MVTFMYSSTGQRCSHYQPQIFMLYNYFFGEKDHLNKKPGILSFYSCGLRQAKGILQQYEKNCTSCIAALLFESSF